ncbi:LytTR family DNA-binding domain-containing protein [Saprospiraceae bacterium]|nr:LytTR family DNA-binding domain-containing protein [Saprospiraceae bacterium]
MIKALIVDDEPLAQEILESYIENLPNVELIAKCSNAIEANEVLKEVDVDIIFLDIQMPQITGIEFVKSLKNPPMIVFTTAYADYAVEGFELAATDYLLKPISMDRFMQAVNKAEQELKNKGVTSTGGKKEDFFFVKADKKLVKVNHSDIIYIEGLKDYVIIRLKAGRVITLQTMKSLEAKLPSNKFRRIHRSYIVATNEIKALMGNMVELTENAKTKLLPIGKNYKEELLKVINENRL